MNFDKSVVFACNGQEYAVPVGQVVSIERLDKMNPIPHLPAYCLGYTRIREELVPVIDFGQVLYNQATTGDLARIVVLHTDYVSFGLVVADAREIIDINPTDLKQVGLVSYSKTKYFSAVANLENRMITCVNPDVLVQSLEGMREIVQYMANVMNEEAASI